MDFEVARSNMIEQQIRPWNVLEMQTLEALGTVRREDFVPEQYRNLAFVDTQIPIGHDEVMLEPKIGARLVESLSLNGSSRVLQIGCGTGYITALLATICEHVTAVEIVPEFCETAKRNLAMAGFSNVEIVQGDCFEFNQDPDYDGVLVTGSVPALGPCFSALIAKDGKLAGVQGHDPVMEAVVISRGGSEESLFETSVPRLKNAVETRTFEF